MTQDRHELQWAASKPVLLTPGSKLKVQVHDSDAVEDDFAFGYEAEVPTHSGRAWVVGRSPEMVTLALAR